MVPIICKSPAKQDNYMISEYLRCICIYSKSGDHINIDLAYDHTIILSTTSSRPFQGFVWCSLWHFHVVWPPFSGDSGAWPPSLGGATSWFAVLWALHGVSNSVSIFCLSAVLVFSLIPSNLTMQGEAPPIICVADLQTHQNILLKL